MATLNDPQIKQDVLDRMNKDIGHNNLAIKSHSKVDIREMPESNITNVNLSRLMPMAKENKDGTFVYGDEDPDEKSRFDNLRELSRNVSDGSFAGLKSRLGVGTSSNSEATDEQWKKCIKRYSDEKKMCHTQDVKIPNLNEINCRESKAGASIQDVLIVPNDVKQSADPNKQTAFREEYMAARDQMMMEFGNTECWTLTDYNDAEKVNKLGGKKKRTRKRKRRSRRNTKKRGRKTRTKKQVKKTRSKKTRGRKTHGRKMSKKRGTRKRSYRKRR